MALKIDGTVYNQCFKEIYGEYLSSDPFLSKVEILEASQKGYSQFVTDNSTYTLNGCCSEPNDSTLTLETCYVACVSNSKSVCKADMNVIDKTVSVRAGESSVGTVGQSLMANMAMNFKNGLTSLAINGDTNLGVQGLLALATGTETGSKTNLFDAVLAGFAAMPSNTLGKISVMLSPSNYNRLKVEIVKKNMYIFSGLDTSTAFMFPGLDIECIAVSGVPEDKIIVQPYSNVVRFCSRIDDEDFINTAFDPIGNVIFSVNALFGISLKNPALSVVVSLT
jgi:hypothetical protein